ncbi:MAG: hypothetical protein GY811_15825 [Myxococcales bacterium]|nr:hypothetical protein [Myxococcales bacterium]
MALAEMAPAPGVLARDFPSPDAERLKAALCQLDRRAQAPAGTKHVEEAKTIAREAKGSAYFVHEIVLHSASMSSEARGESTTLASVIQARASMLSGEARRLLNVVCLAGCRLTLCTAQDSAQMGLEPGRSFIELRAGHFVRGSGTSEDDTIEPYQDRVRETLVMKRRRALQVHERCPPIHWSVRLAISAWLGCT